MFQLSALLTHHETVLSCELSDGQITSHAKFNESQEALRFLRCDQRLGLGFLFHASYRQLYLEGEPDSFPVIPVRLLKLPEGKIALRHCWQEAFLRSRNDGHIDFAATSIDLWEQFETIDLGLSLERILPADLLSILSCTINSETLQAWMAKAEFDTIKSWLPALLKTLSLSEFQNTTRRIFDNPKSYQTFAEVLAHDHWMNSSLRPHHRFALNMDSAVPHELDDKLDQLSNGDLGEHAPPPLGLALTAAFRRSVEPKYQICVLSTAKDEGINLVDWIAFHRAIGVEHFFLYTNHNTDGSDSLLYVLQKAGLITWIDSNPASRANPQRKSYLHALTCLPDILRYKWTAVIDLDEFIVLDPERYSCLEEFLALQELRGASGVGLNWVMMIAHQLKWDEPPIWQRITDRDPYPHSLIKSIFLTNRASFAHAHKPLWGHLQRDLFVDAQGHHRKWSRDGVPAYEVSVERHAWIAHYFYRTLEEFVWKNARGRNATFSTQSATKFSPHFVTEWLTKSKFEKSLPHPNPMLWNALASNEAKRLRDLPGVSEAEGAIRAIFKQKVPDLVRGSSKIVEESDLPSHIKLAWQDVVTEYLTKKN